MTYWLLTILLANGQHLTGYAYGSKFLCDHAAHGIKHTCTKVYYGSDR